MVHDRAIKYGTALRPFDQLVETCKPHTKNFMGAFCLGPSLGCTESEKKTLDVNRLEMTGMSHIMENLSGYFIALPAPCSPAGR
jgi:hypothetical protein